MSLTLFDTRKECHKHIRLFLYRAGVKKVIEANIALLLNDAVYEEDPEVIF
jgi:hypothetical protein